MITKGDFGYTSKWEIEYGAVIHDVPVVKRAMYRGWNGKEVVPVHESTVEKAEEYLDVNESEYEPSTYDFEISSERKTINTILLIVMAIAGIFCVSNVIMLTIRAKRRVRSVSAKPIRTIPPA